MSDFLHKIKMPPWAKIEHGAPDATTPLLSDAASDHSSGSDSSPSTSDKRPLLAPRHSQRGPGTSPGAPAASSGYFDDDAPAWSDPLGRPSRGDHDEHLVMFRRAVGINSDLAARSRHSDEHQDGILEAGHQTAAAAAAAAAAVGIYAAVLRQERQKRRLHHAVSGMVWGCHGLQIVLGAALTCLGLNSRANAAAVTALGAANTVVAGVLALVKGKSLPERLGRAEADFRQLKVWIEETESLLALGVIGGDRREVGSLIQTAFRRFNACSGRSFDFEADVDRGIDGFGVEDGHDGEMGYDNS